jgi:hypothetical protein
VIIWQFNENYFHSLYCKIVSLHALLSKIDLLVGYIWNTQLMTSNFFLKCNNTVQGFQLWFSLQKMYTYMYLNYIKLTQLYQVLFPIAFCTLHHFLIWCPATIIKILYLCNVVGSCNYWPIN